MGRGMLRVCGTLFVGLFVAAPGLAAGKGASLQGLAAAHLGAAARDVAVLATAVPLAREGSAGSAALVRVDDGSDGGNPACHLLILAGRPATPGRIDATARLSLCPRYDKGKGTRLDRVALGSRRAAWQVRLETARVDTIAKGVETQVLWALLATPQGGSAPEVVWERASTTFRSKDDPRLNQAELCDAPVVQASDELAGLELPCETEVMLGSLPKRQRQVFRYRWEGARFVAE